MLPADRVIDAPVTSLDLLPTALAAASVAVPAKAKFDGVNLLPFLTGKSDKKPHEALFWRYGEQTAVRAGDWKLTCARDTTMRPPTIKTGLYDLAHDPGEQHDLSAENPGKVKELQKLWEAWNFKNMPALWTDKPATQAKEKDKHNHRLPCDSH